MSTNTPILNIVEVATSQNQKETTINTGLVILEAAMNDANIVDLSAGNHTLTTTEFCNFFMQRCQGHTVARNLSTPAAAGGYTGKRFFIVSNEGTGVITVKPGGSGSGTLTVGAASIALIQCDGTTLRAISSGVSMLTDLSDVDVTTVPPTNGQVLKYNSGTSKWDAGSFSSSNFTGLGDCPPAYTTFGRDLVRVNAAETGLEFIPIPFEIQLGFSGVPLASQNKQYIFLRTAKLLATLPGAKFFTGTLPTATTTFNLVWITAGTPTTVGSVAFSTLGVGTVTFTADVTFVAGDILQIQAPASPDATAADISFGFLPQIP